MLWGLTHITVADSAITVLMAEVVSGGVSLNRRLQLLRILSQNMSLIHGILTDTHMPLVYVPLLLLLAAR